MNADGENVSEGQQQQMLALLDAKTKTALGTARKSIATMSDDFKKFFSHMDEDVLIYDDETSMVIAYEPIWAIGTGKTATADQAEEVCKAIRECIAEIYDTDTAEKIRIQYGGSMNAGNCKELLAKPDIDGGLIGGASLKADFGEIVNYNK